MGRPAKFDLDSVLDAALRVLDREGMRALTATRVCAELGAPSGSLYHRFASRDALLIELWLRCAERFQAGYYAALESSADPRSAAHAAVRYFVERARAHGAEARVLMAYRREDLIAGKWPAAIRRRAQALEDAQRAAQLRFAKRLWPRGTPDLGRMSYALLGLPYAATIAELRGAARSYGDSIAWVEAALDAVLADCFMPAPKSKRGRD